MLLPNPQDMRQYLEHNLGFVLKQDPQNGYYYFQHPMYVTTACDTLEQAIHKAYDEVREVKRKFY